MVIFSGIFVGGQGRNADALALYFGEDPARCPFEQGNIWLVNNSMLCILCTKVKTN